MSYGQNMEQGPRNSGYGASAENSGEQMRRQTSASSATSNGRPHQGNNGLNNGHTDNQPSMHSVSRIPNNYQRYPDQSQVVNPYMNPYSASANTISSRQAQADAMQQHRRMSSQGQAPHLDGPYQYPPQGQFYPPPYQASQLNQQRFLQQIPANHQYGVVYQHTAQPQYQAQLPYQPYQHPQQGRHPSAQGFGQVPAATAQISQRRQSTGANGIPQPHQQFAEGQRVNDTEKATSKAKQRTGSTSPVLKKVKHENSSANNANDLSMAELAARELNLPIQPVKPPQPKVPGQPVALPYDVDSLTWNAEKSLNQQNRYCYCGEDRNLLDLDVQCHQCGNFFHGRCIRIDLGFVVPFMTNYQFTCINCSSNHNEEWTRAACAWKNICASIVANLILIRLRVEHPSWDKSKFAAQHNDAILDLDYGWYSRKQDIIPFLKVPRHWVALCTEKELGDSAAWTSTLANALVSNPDLFFAHDESNRSANSYYTLQKLSLFSFRPGFLSSTKSALPKKRKVDDAEPSTKKALNTIAPPLDSSLIIPPERSSNREKSTTKAEDAPSFSQKIPTIKKEPPRGLTAVAKELVRERKPTPKKAAIAKKVDVAPAKLIRRPPPYKPEDFGAIPKGPGMTQVEGQFHDGPYFSMQDIPYNKRGFKYTPCEAAPEMPAIMYRQVEVGPHAARLDWSDMSPYLYLSKDAQTATTDKGFRMGRANVGVREGQWYWEVKVLRGNGEQGGHVRLGIARREASIDGPIGFDGYSYGIRDKGGEKMHLSRPKAFMESFGTGDVIGFHLTLPKAPKTEVSRDRIPIRYRQQLYFEQFEYTSSKEMEDLLHPGSIQTKSNLPPTLKGSSLKVYKNGKLMGNAFTDLYSFWPPNSQTTRDQPAKDDGGLGYFPAVSVYHGGAVRLNFGPDFEYAPKKVLDGSIRKMCERYDEQVAEDVVYDLIDEVDFARDLEELSLGQQELEVAPIREIAEYD